MNPTRLSNNIGKDWNVQWISKTSHHEPSNEGILCSYPKRSFAGESGTHFRACPKPFPCDGGRIEFEVFVPPTFDFVRGGKLGPGMWCGEPGAGGRDWSDTAASCRLMWRAGGEVVAYVYLCEDSGKYNGTGDCPLMRAQGRGFDKIATHTNGAGIDVWRNEGLKLKKGQWNSIAVAMTMNSRNQPNGSLTVECNSKKKEFSRLMWSKRGLPIEGIVFASWFGGGDASYAPQKDESLLFRDITVARVVAPER